MKFMNLKKQIHTSKHTLSSNRNEQIVGQYTYEPSELACKCLSHLLTYEKRNVTFPWSMKHYESDCYLFLYCNHGQAQATILEQSYELKEHTFLFFDCSIPFRIEITHSTWGFEAMYFNGDDIVKYYDMFLSDGVPVCDDDSSLLIQSIIRNLNLKQEKLNSINELLRSKTITELLTYALILKLQKTQKTYSIPDYIIKMKNILEQRYAENLTLDSIASEINYNKFKLAKDFKHYTTYSPIDYLIRIRITTAKELLEDTRLSISEIGYQVGIENTPHFINLFKKATGTTPNRYRIHRRCKIVN